MENEESNVKYFWNVGNNCWNKRFSCHRLACYFFSFFFSRAADDSAIVKYRVSHIKASVVQLRIGNFIVVGG